MAVTRGLAATMLRFFDNSNLQHQPGVPPEERRVNAMAAALVCVTERDCGGVVFRLGDTVETVKGANFWGEIIAFDADEASPGCTVRAVDPGFEGTKHVYPLKQLRHRLVKPLPKPDPVRLARARYVVENPSAWESFDQEKSDIIAYLIAHIEGTSSPRPADEWHEDHGDVVWWTLDENGRWLGEAPYVGSPLDLGRTILVTVDGKEMACEIDGWPGYHTHWTPCPDFPPLPVETGSVGK